MTRHSRRGVGPKRDKYKCVPKGFLGTEYQGYAGFGPFCHLPGFHFGCRFLSHTQTLGDVLGSAGRRRRDLGTFRPRGRSLGWVEGTLTL